MSDISNAETDAARFNKGVIGLPRVPGVCLFRTHTRNTLDTRGNFSIKFQF